MLACISGCSGVIGCKVATGGVLRVKNFAQHGLIVGVSVKKFALRARNTPNLTFLRLLGELCHGLSGRGAVLGELCHGLSGGEGVPGEFCHACRLATVTGPCTATGPATVLGTVPGPTLPLARHHSLRCLRHPPHRRRWGFCSMRSWLSACRGSNDVISPCGSSEVPVMSVSVVPCWGCAVVMVVSMSPRYRAVGLAAGPIDWQC